MGAGTEIGTTYQTMSRRWAYQVCFPPTSTNIHVLDDSVLHMREASRQVRVELSPSEAAYTTSGGYGNSSHRLLNYLS